MARENVTVLSPNGGEEWESGETNRVTWNSSGVSSVQIYIYNPSISGSGSTNYITADGLPISAALGYYDWAIPSLGQLPGGGGNTYKIRIFDADNSTIEDYSNNYFSIVAAGTTAVCDSTSFATYDTAYSFGSNSGTISNVCGGPQYYKITVPSGQTCGIKWTLQPDSDSDYDLYVRWGTGALSKSNYGAKAVAGKGLKDELPETSLSSGTYYALVYKESGTTGSYSITASLTNCTTSTTPTTCDSTSFASSSASFDFGTAGGTKSNVCGQSQYYKITVPSGQTCGIKWTLQPDSGIDFDLYARWGTGALSKSNYDDRAVLGKGLKDEISKNGLSAGAYYALVYKEKGAGSYSITVSLINCTGFTPSSSTDTQVQIAQLQSQINQILAIISQLQAELANLQGGTTWCYTFRVNLRYKDSGADVTALQTALQKEGIYTGTIDGYFGTAILEAVITFQEKYQTEILAPWRLSRGTGFVGQTTINKLDQLYKCK